LRTLEAAIVATRAQPRFWRQLTGWFALYVLVLHGILAGLAVPHMAGQAVAGHELCLHDSGDAGTAPGQPSDESQGGHCLLCVALAQGAIIPMRAAMPGIALLFTMSSFRPVAVARAAIGVERIGHRTRAPPVVA
jgi:DUF2946 family protein